MFKKQSHYKYIPVILFFIILSLIYSCYNTSRSNSNDYENIVPVTGINLDMTATSISIGSSKQLTATIEPSNATNQNISWSTSDEQTATVSSGNVSGIDIGTAVVTVITEDGDFKATCSIEIPIPDPGHKITLTADTINFAMVYVTGQTIPTGTDDAAGEQTINNDFWIAETEVTYELWKKIRDWAITDAGDGNRVDGGDLYYFQNPGLEGSAGTVGAPVTNQEPVSTVNWHDAIVWCNALTEWYNANKGTNYTCVYTYSDEIIRDSQDTNATACDDAVAVALATGFRILSSKEWELAARWRNDSTNTVPGYTDPYFTKGNSASGAYTFYNDTSDVNPFDGIDDCTNTNYQVAVYGFYWNGTPTGVTETAEVKSKLPNSLEIYDMSGNVYEWCFEEVGTTHRFRRGGSMDVGPAQIVVGQGGAYLPGEAYYDLGLRIARTQW